jgi:hypothetical protein
MASLPDADRLLHSYFALADNELRTEEDMPATSSCRILIVALVVAAAASLASSAYAGPRVSTGTLSAVQKATLEISPGSLAGNAGASTARATHVSPASLTPLQLAALEISPGSMGTILVPEAAAPSANGFRWDDAGLGAAAILLLSAAVATAVTIGRRRSQRLVAR